MIHFHHWMTVQDRVALIELGGRFEAWLMQNIQQLASVRVGEDIRGWVNWSQSIIGLLIQWEKWRIEIKVTRNETVVYKTQKTTNLYICKLKVGLYIVDNLCYRCPSPLCRCAQWLCCIRWRDQTLKRTFSLSVLHQYQPLQEWMAWDWDLILLNSQKVFPQNWKFRYI